MNLSGKAGANEYCRGAGMQRTQKYAFHNVWDFLFHYFCKVVHTKFILPEAHFHTESIGASPVVIAHKKVKLFKFLGGISKLFWKG